MALLSEFAKIAGDFFLTVTGKRRGFWWNTPGNTFSVQANQEADNTLYIAIYEREPKQKNRVHNIALGVTNGKPFLQVCQGDEVHVIDLLSLGKFCDSLKDNPGVSLFSGKETNNES